MGRYIGDGVILIDDTCNPVGIVLSVQVDGGDKQQLEVCMTFLKLL